ncbi:MAG: heterodisulfide reductase-related iron-sulfur binding cluster [Syntrophobacteraceae bacterium]
MLNNSPESMAGAVLERCADCDVCRYLMEDTPCRVFPEIYRLHDKEAEGGGRMCAKELRQMVDLCNFCALCPCPDIRADLMKAKHAFVRRDGLKPTIRLLEEVGRLARVCGAYPRLANSLLQHKRTGNLLKKLGGIHPARKLPEFPEEGFPSWARRQGLYDRRESSGRKVAYFAGCTAQYLFPDVPKAVVEILRHNEIEVFLPEQKCCGMPSLLEGDLDLTCEFAAFNLDRLCEAVDSGYDIVCSCPTCGYMLKHVVSEGALYARKGLEARRPGAGPYSASIMHELYRFIDRKHEDEGYFASLDPLKRIRVADHTFDLGEYLRSLLHAGRFNKDLGTVSARMAYYPPCHLREQKIGEPYADLLGLVPGASVERIEGAFHCCGIAGIMGFKKEFYRVSVEMGSRLMRKIEEIHPERLVTDCLSCRIQFSQLTPYTVLHPVEILREAYSNWLA